MEWLIPRWILCLNHCDQGGSREQGGDIRTMGYSLDRRTQALGYKKLGTIIPLSLVNNHIPISGIQSAVSKCSAKGRK